jgi:hypothetical protein
MGFGVPVDDQQQASLVVERWDFVSDDVALSLWRRGDSLCCQRVGC